MYETFFGVSERPFDLTANPKYLFLSPSHREALSNLHYAIAAHAGVTALIGEAGTGKTTLIAATLTSREAMRAYPVYLNNPALTRTEFLQFLAREFSLGREAEASKTVLLDKLRRALIRYRDAGVSPALIVDEAQSLPHELLEEIRLLSNIEVPSGKLLSIVLAGQPELAQRLNEPSLRQLKQRVELRCELKPLNLEETSAYIAARIRHANGEASTIFTREAVQLIYDASTGIPRTISVLCNNAMTSGFALGQRPIGPQVVSDICTDFDVVPTGPRLTVVRPSADRMEGAAVAPHRVTEQSHSGKELLKMFVRPFRRLSLFQQS